MTILMAYRGPDYTLVAADRRATVKSTETGEWIASTDEIEFEDVGTGRRWKEPRIKVAVHPDPRIPVAWATGGIDELPFEGEQHRVSDLIAWALRNSHKTINSTDLDFLLPLVEQTQIGRMDILLGTSTTTMHLQFIAGGPAHWWPVPEAAIIPSQHTQAFLDGLSSAEKFPPRGLEPRKAAKFIRRLLQRAIEAAREIAGDRADVGGTIDLAVAQRTRARIFTE